MFMRDVRLFLILAGTVLVLVSCENGGTTDPAGQAKTIEDLVVRSNEISGWGFAGNAWTASTVSDLTRWIDGKAEIFQRHGFVEAAHREYQGTVNNASTQLQLSVYDQGSQANALALYGDQDLGFSGALDWKSGAGQGAHYVRYSLSQALAFYRGKYFVLLEINSGTDESLNVLKQFALNVDGKIGNG